MRDSELRPQVHNVHAALYCANESALRIVFQILSSCHIHLSSNYSLADSFYSLENIESHMIH
jgi:hypothetical protein